VRQRAAKRHLRMVAIVTSRGRRADMTESMDTHRSELEIDEGELQIDEAELRRRSDQILEAIARLTNVEVDKREAQPGTPEFVAVATAVKLLAQALLDLATDEERLARRLQMLRQDAQGAVSERSIAETPGTRPIRVVLAEWRAAERRLIEAEAGSEAERNAKAEAERLRAEYQRAAAEAPRTI
jgi:hypothetical protein